MTDDDGSGWSVPTPPFKAAEALVGLKRQLREFKPLAERGTGFEFKARPAIELAVTDDRIDARIARRPASRPEWTTHNLHSGADVRRFIDTVRQQLRRWEQED